MSVQDPHRACHEATEFWYSFEYRALLYDVEVDGYHTYVKAAHSPEDRQTHLDERVYPHRDPHGFKFSSHDMTEAEQEACLANVELVVRLFGAVRCEGDSEKPSWDKPTLFPVPKLLALFLEAKRTEMYKAECLTQAILLLQVNMSSIAS